MTNEQIKSVQSLKVGFAENCKQYIEYGSTKYCTFSVYINEKNEQDDNVVVSMNKIGDIDDWGYPLTDNTQLLIEPDGNVIPLNQIIPDNQVRIKYFAGLTKIDYQDE
jgi:hypothetical protein